MYSTSTAMPALANVLSELMAVLSAEAKEDVVSYGPPVSWILPDWVPFTVNCKFWLPELGVKLKDEISFDGLDPVNLPWVPRSK